MASTVRIHSFDDRPHPYHQRPNIGGSTTRSRANSCCVRALAQRHDALRLPSLPDPVSWGMGCSNVMVPGMKRSHSGRFGASLASRRRPRVGPSDGEG